MIIIDTNIYVAYLNKRDQNHEKARKLVHRLLSGEYGARFTVSEVFTETSTLLYRQTKRMDIIQNAWDLFYSEQYAWGQTLLVTREIIDKAWKLFQKHVSQKRTLSFVDCILLATAQLYQIHQIISFDKEFEGLLVRIHI